MSTLKVDTILKRTGTGTITVGQSGDTVALPSVTLTTALPVAQGGIGSTTLAGAGLSNAPAFQTYISSHQTVSSGVHTKFQGSVEEVDSGGAYDNSTNYRWTCPSGQGGVYFFWWKIFLHFNGNTFNGATNAYLKKNGSQISATANNDGPNTTGNDETFVPITGNFMTNISAGDYVELFGYATTSNSGSYYFISNSNGWGGMKLIGA